MAGNRSKALPRIERNGVCHQLIVDGKPLLLLAAETQNSSASSMEYMEEQGCWERLKGYNCNTALVPAYWEMVEPEEGCFDFSLVEGLLEAARRHGLRLVLLWFGTWKNAESSYAPVYVKTDLTRFPRCQLANGRNTRAVSPLSQAACQADSRAFASLMQHIRSIDASEQTVLMMQVENEIGLLGAERDFSPAAERRFRQPVPAELMEHLDSHRDELHPTLRRYLDRRQIEGDGCWHDVFGPLAAEAFMAWHFARYVEEVAAAGKAVYGLPMFVNAWLDGDGPPGGYPSGGPVAKMLDVWRAAAPSLDAFAPDTYTDDFVDTCAEFARPFNPFLIPETRPKPAAQEAFWAIAQCGAICFSPFGLDHPHCWTHLDWRSEGLAETYALLRDMMPVITSAQEGGRIRGVLQRAEPVTRLELGGYELTVRYNRIGDDRLTPGAGLIVQLDEDEFAVAGRGFAVAFAPDPLRGDDADFLWAEQGRFEDGRWIAERRLNGDDTWPSSLRLPDGPETSIRRGKLYRYR